MIKTWEEYYNDPEIAGEHPFMREIHAIRLMNHDKTKDMTVEERTAYFHNMATRPLDPPCRPQKPLEHKFFGDIIPL